MADIPPDSEYTRRLLEKARAGDQQAFEQLFARYKDYLRQVIDLRLDPRVRSRIDPSDVVQETQLEAFQRLPDYCDRQPMPFRLWLRQTARQRLLMAHRHHLGAARRTVDREVCLPDRSSVLLARQLLAASSSPSQKLSRRELTHEVQQAVAQLSDGDREILLMRSVEGLSNQEAAQVLGIEPATASQRYGRALLRLRNVLVAAGLLESHS